MHASPPNLHGLVLLAGLTAMALPAAATDSGSGPDFNRDVRPILAAHCFKCHGPDPSGRKAKLRLDDPAAARAERDDGRAIDPDDPMASLLLTRIRSADPEERMPPGDVGLSAAEVATLEAWIAAGAPYAEPWAWQPVAPPAPPPVTQREWCRSPIDQFLLAQMEARDIRPGPDADDDALLRRASFALTGLPPTTEELLDFRADEPDTRVSKAIDRLLASPAFGERWGRHWLDIVRYAETLGHEFDYPIRDAWRYRDWVVSALNEDLPYDRFVVEQIAGDLVPDPRRNAADGTDASLPGTGFWYLTQATHAPVDVRQDELDRIDNQVDVLAKAFLGVTLSCARCHDHKFDPIRTEDYYAMSGYARSTEWAHGFLDPNGRIGAARDAVRGEMENAQREALAALANESEALAERAVAVAPLAPPTQLSLRPGATLLESFDTPLPASWRTLGHAFGVEQPLVDGWPGVAHSGAAGSAFQGTLRSPAFTIDSDFIHVRVRGDACTVRLYIDGYRMDEFNPLLFEGLLQKVSSPGAWVDLAMRVARYRGERAVLEVADEGDGWIAIDAIAASATADDPFVVGAWTGEDLQKAAQALGRGPLDDRSRALVGALRTAPGEGEAAESADEAVRRSVARQEAARRDARPPAPVRVLCALDGTPVDERILVRGSKARPADVAARRLVASIGGTDQPAASDHGSGRLELAARIASPDNPLFARVMVNRVWQHLMGRGLVETPDDFGALGKPPSHPELLDWLAADFATDWSVKRLIRTILATRAWRLSSAIGDTVAEAADPTNETWHRMNLTRLEGEAIRDAMLVASGSMDLQVGGPPVPIHLTDAMQGRGRPTASGPLDGAGRRSIYLEVRRNFPLPLLVAFDQPVPNTTIGRRTCSNVPAQALALANDPFVEEQALRWAVRAIEHDPSDSDARLNRMVRAAFGRDARPEERAAAARVLATSPLGPYSTEAWAMLARAFFRSQEFIQVP